jgi:hypothetical protein
MSSTIELMNEMNDMCQQMKSFLHSHKKTTRALLRKVGDQHAKIARLEREKMFNDASFRRIYSEFGDYRAQTDLRIEELTKDLDDQKNIVRNLSHVMWGNPNSDSDDPEDMASDVVLETNEPENPYIIYENVDVNNSLNNYYAVINRMRNLHRVFENHEHPNEENHDDDLEIAPMHINSPRRLRRGSRETPGPSPTPPRFIAPEGVEVPNEFLCPITLEIMQDPVIASDGNTYERLAIQQYISMHAEYPLSPLTRDVLQSNILIGNNNLMKMISDFCIPRVVSTQEQN